jgi:hypothetical protein
MFLQQRRGISVSITPTFSRAGLKIEALLGPPHRLDRIALRRVGAGGGRRRGLG